ncbi:MAG: extracellular solute-binding protein [Acetatifactor muris]|nr:extracellular solute-binding protein [Acetatifactor muris]
MDNREKSAGIWKIDAAGHLQDYVNMNLESTGDAIDLLLKGVYTVQNGYSYIWCEMLIPEEKKVEGTVREVWHYIDRVYVKDSQLNTIFYEEIPRVSRTEVLNFQVAADGSPIFIVRDEEGVYIKEIDVAQGKLKDEVRLEKSGGFFEADYASSLENIVAIEDGFLYCQNNELFEYHYNTQTTKKLLNLSGYGIYSSDILFLAKKGDAIEIISNFGESDCSEFISFTPGESEKKTVTLGMIMTAQDLERMVTEFNRYSSDYRVEIVDYFDRTGDYDKAAEQLKLDIITGTAPNIIALSGIDRSMLSEKGVLADLYDFMKDDEECSKDILVQSVAEAYEDGGHLYSIAPGFQLHSMWGYDDVIDGHSGVTFDELFQILEDSGKDLNAIAGFSGDEPVLTRLCTVAMDEFIDWENGMCNFEGDYFKKVLSFAKEYTGNYTGGTYLQRIQNREVVMSVGIISSVIDYQIAKEMYGADVAFIGYPVAEGTGTVITFRGSDVAVNAKKENREGAWEFVKFYLLHGYDGQGFPIVQEQFDQILDASMEEEYYITQQGDMERQPKGFYSTVYENIEIYAATQEDVDTVRRLVEGAANRFEPHWDIQVIINEEAEGYFSGQVDLDSTVKKIQNRVSLLLQEIQ